MSDDDNERIDGNDKSEKKDNKAQVHWTEEMFNALLDVCIRGGKEGKRKGCGFPRHWDWAVREFRLASGCNLTQVQLKHKIDWMMKEYKKWKKLKGSETGLGWDPNKKTIDASDEWWEERIKRDKKLAKFRKKGIDPGLERMYSMIFDDNMATGDFAYGPSMDFVHDVNQDENDNAAKKNMVVELNSMEESSDDSDGEDVARRKAEYDKHEASILAGNYAPIFDDLDPEVSSDMPHDGVGVVGKKKRRVTAAPSSYKHSKPNARTKKSGSVALSENIKQLVGCLERESIARHVRSSNATKMTERNVPTMTDIMQDVSSLPKMVISSQLYSFSGALLLDKEKRELYAALPDAIAKYNWLEFMFERDAYYKFMGTKDN